MAYMLTKLYVEPEKHSSVFYRATLCQCMVGRSSVCPSQAKWNS